MRAHSFRPLAALLLAGLLAATAACSTAEAREEGRTIVVKMIDDGAETRFEPAHIDVRKGDIVRFEQHGVMPHNVQFVANEAPRGAELSDAWNGPYLSSKGESYEVVIDDRFADGDYTYVCTPHIATGMVATMTVSGAGDGPGRAASNKPEVSGVQGLQELPYTMDGNVKVFELTAEKIRWETKEGHLVDAMAYNRMIPGPVIRATEGERVRIVVNNEMDEPHTTHWHGLFVPNNMDGVPGISQDPIMPGESFVYEFDANPAGTRLYHSHFNAMTQEGSGLYGMFIIEERNPSRQMRADREELMILGDGPLGFIINGKEFPLIEPIQMKMGERVRVRIANLGAMYHPMHLHGGFFDVVAKDGFELAAPRRENTLSVAPGETYDIILHPQFAGTWIWHCHVLSHATGPRDADGNETAAGMIGVVVVDDGETPLVDMSNHTHH
jgi:manganese oxidase